jgi:hypothetical protein
MTGILSVSTAGYRQSNQRTPTIIGDYIIDGEIGIFERYAEGNAKVLMIIEDFKVTGP